MAFPVNGLIDAWTAANAAPPSASYSALGGFAADLQCISNQVRSNSAGTGADYWNPNTFGPSCENYLDVDILPSVDASFIALLFINQINPASATLRCGYALGVVWRSGATVDEWTLYRYDNNAATALGAMVNQNVAAGEKVGIERRGSVINAYLYTGGAWNQTPILSRTDSTYTAAGYMGVGTTGQTVRLNNWSGGSLGTILQGRIDMTGEIIADWNEPVSAVIDAQFPFAVLLNS